MYPFKGSSVSHCFLKDIVKIKLCEMEYIYLKTVSILGNQVKLSEIILGDITLQVHVHKIKFSIFEWHHNQKIVTEQYLQSSHSFFLPLKQFYILLPKLFAEF